MKEFWGGLSSMQKLLASIIIVALLWFFVNRFKGTLQGMAGSIQAGGEMAQLSSAGIKPSYSDAEYRKMADDLEKAMNGIGTDNAAVFNTFKKLKNDADFIKLDTAFGVRDASDNLFGLIEGSDLSGWIHGDLSENQINQLNNQLRNQGLSKTF